MSPRRLQGVFKLCLQDVLTTSLAPQFFVFSSRHLQDVLQRRLARCLQDVIKTSSRLLEDALEDKTCCAKDVFKISWRYVLKTYWRNALKTSWRPTNVSWVAVFLLQNRVSNFFLICFTREIKGFYQISWGNEVGFMDMVGVFP